MVESHSCLPATIAVLENCELVSLAITLFDLLSLNSNITSPHCNNYTDLIHQTRTKLVRDLSIFGRLVYLFK
ncbi:transposase family protein [Microcoleus anatoxicus]|uniref:transposase family protein n=1 Tax=Microcoleus anatoxicus TaxID=2705319 RepID=UPI003BF5DF4E